MDCEGIQTSKTHICIRKLYILASDGITDHQQEFVACTSFEEIEDKYKKAFIYCNKNIHKLCYYPTTMSMPCQTAAKSLQTFIENNNIKIVLFKGGIIEMRLCKYLEIEYYDIGSIVPKVASHDPRIEVLAHLHYLTTYCKDVIKTIMQCEQKTDRRTDPNS